MKSKIIKIGQKLWPGELFQYFKPDFLIRLIRNSGFFWLMTIYIKRSVHRDLVCIPRWLVQSRPIQMRGTILYLANRWMDFKMLSTPNSFLDLRRVLLLPFGWIPQFIAQFWCICPLLCTPLSILLIIIQMRAAAKQQERKKGRMGEKSFPS